MAHRRNTGRATNSPVSSTGLIVYRGMKPYPWVNGGVCMSATRTCDKCGCESIATAELCYNQSLLRTASADLAFLSWEFILLERRPDLGGHNCDTALAFLNARHVFVCFAPLVWFT